MAKGSAISEPLTAAPLYRTPYARLVWLLLAAGALFRVAQYAANRSLWTDECLLVLNLIHKSFAQLLQPLADNQAAPIGFLIAEKGMAALFGPVEYSLRLIPLCAAITALFLFRKLAYSVLEPAAVPLAMALFASSDILIYYASEVKQYSLDVAAALAIYLAAVPGISANGPSRRQLAYLAVTGTAALWLSHAAFFVLGAACAALGIVAVQRRRYRTLAWLSAVGLLWAVNAGALYLISLHSAAENSWLRAYWAFSFMPLPPTSLAELVWFPRTLLYIVKTPIGLSIPITHPAGLLLSVVAVLVVAAGALRMLRTRPVILALIVGPGVFALFASGLQLYPFYGRLLLFFFPAVLLIAASGLAWIPELMPARARWVQYLFAVLLLAYPSLNAVYHLSRPREVEEARTVLATLARQRRNGDVVCLYYGGAKTFEYYAVRFGLDRHPYLVLRHSGRSWQPDLEDIDRLRGKARVWVVISHYMDVKLGDGRQTLLRHLDSIGQRLYSMDEEGAGLYLYNLAH